MVPTHHASGQSRTAHQPPAQERVPDSSFGLIVPGLLNASPTNEAVLGNSKITLSSMSLFKKKSKASSFSFFRCELKFFSGYYNN